MAKSNTISHLITEDGKYEVYLNGKLFGFGWADPLEAKAIIDMYNLKFKTWHTFNWFEKYIIHSGLQCYISS